MSPDAVVTESLPGFEPALRTVRIFCDGGSRGNPGPAGIGAVVLDASREPARVLTTVSETIGIATNNVAEYQALISGLEAAAEFDAHRIEVRADSQLLIRQLEGRYRVKNAGLQPLYRRAMELLRGYAEVDLQHVYREDNTEADALVNAALDAAAT
ncbi:MAG: ribonuclease HI family protein [Acidimicrobiia bacterium]